MTHVFCTGAAGFAGSHLADLLLAYGHTVTIVDNLSRGNNLPITGGGWNLCMADLTQKCPTFPSDSVVIHMAARVAGIEYNRHNHYDMQRTNELINLHVMEAVREGHPRLFINTSTVCVYNPDSPVPTPETEGEIGNPEKSNWGYGIGKWAGEQLARSLCLEYEIPTIIVRPSNLFGERDHYDEGSSHVVPALIKRIMDGENPIVVWGSGNQTRSFLDVKDLARAYVKLMDWGLSFHPNNPVIVNVGHAREISIRELVETLLEVCGAGDRRILFDAERPDGYPRRGSSVEVLQALIGWTPSTPLRETLESMVRDYCRRYRVSNTFETSKEPCAGACCS